MRTMHLLESKTEVIIDSEAGIEVHTYSVPCPHTLHTAILLSVANITHELMVELVSKWKRMHESDIQGEHLQLELSTTFARALKHLEDVDRLEEKARPVLPECPDVDVTPKNTSKLN